MLGPRTAITRPTRGPGREARRITTGWSGRRRLDGAPALNRVLGGRERSMFYADTVGLKLVPTNLPEYRARHADRWTPALLLERLAGGDSFYRQAT